MGPFFDSRPVLLKRVRLLLGAPRGAPGDILSGLGFSWHFWDAPADPGTICSSWVVLGVLLGCMLVLLDLFLVLKLKGTAAAKAL